MSAMETRVWTGIETRRQRSERNHTWEAWKRAEEELYNAMPPLMTPTREWYLVHGWTEQELEKIKWK